MSGRKASDMEVLERGLHAARVAWRWVMGLSRAEDNGRRGGPKGAASVPLGKTGEEQVGRRWAM